MTTEITIMNKSAIALAADSAVTIRHTQGDEQSLKIFNSANKLFALSKHAPIGLMVYGAASLLGVPWETIIKIYTDKLGTKKFSTTKEYCNDFFCFLDKFNIGADAEKDYISSTAWDVLIVIWQKFKDKLEKQKEFTEEDAINELKNIVEDEFIAFEKVSKDSILSKNMMKKINKIYSDTINQVIEDIFGKMRIPPACLSKMRYAVVFAASVGPINQSGVVITGFGEEEIFPCCYDYDVAAILAGKTIKRNGNHAEIKLDMEASIRPFAQSDDVHAFMRGIAPNLHKFFSESLNAIMTDSLPKYLQEAISSKLKLTGIKQDELLNITQETCKGVHEEILRQLDSQQRVHYINPILDATSYLNKEELATMAETLVNLVSFRKQVSMQNETVGGPIDVAIITKGDGFIWIKRKQYFNTDLNHHYFNNFFQGREL